MRIMRRTFRLGLPSLAVTIAVALIAAVSALAGAYGSKISVTGPSSVTLGRFGRRGNSFSGIL